MFRVLHLWRVAKHDLPLLWFALRHQQRPLWLIPALILLLWYALDPLNLALPIVGLVDELVVVPLALHLVLKLLPRPILAEFDPQQRRD